MKISNNIKRAIFVKRINRFEAYVILDKQEILVHVPNTGRCKEILTLNAIVILREENGKNRKTRYDLIAVYKGNKLINIDSQIPNKVVNEALNNKVISNLTRYTNILKEKTFGKSRFDFKLSDDNGNIYYLEVKGVTLEENGFVKFPDAPTERGKKHLLELIEVKKQNMGAGILFLIQMDNVKSFSPNYEMDKNFTKALKMAQNSGIDILAYQCDVSEDSITLKNEVKIIL